MHANTHSIYFSMYVAFCDMHLLSPCLLFLIVRIKKYSNTSSVITARVVLACIKLSVLIYILHSAVYACMLTFTCLLTIPAKQAL
jgi:hypothetical protein